MEDNATLSAYRENVVPVVDMVFQTMLGIRVKPYPMPWDRPQQLITAAVYFVGSWNGAVLLECSPKQAVQLCRLLMTIDPPSAVNDDVRDAVGELANMVAGNLKSVLPHGVALSMPSVVEGSDYSLKICGRRAVERVAFWSSEGIFGITMVETSDRPDAVRESGTCKKREV